MKLTRLFAALTLLVVLLSACGQAAAPGPTPVPATQAPAAQPTAAPAQPTTAPAPVPATATSKPIEVVVTVARAGFGAQAAAPVARQILSQWFFGRKGPWTGYGGGAL